MTPLYFFLSFVLSLAALSFAHSIGWKDGVHDNQQETTVLLNGANKTMREALTLIKAQKAEIEDLKKLLNK